METALMLIQVRTGRFILGSFVGLGAAALMSWAWAHYGHRLNIKRFFQVTGAFLLLFSIQIAVYSIHEFSEAGILPNSEAIHLATEPYSPVGVYGRWFTVLLVVLCGLWLAGATMADRMRQKSAVMAR
jgi:high-affinity iron transporter